MPELLDWQNLPHPLVEIGLTDLPTWHPHGGHLSSQLRRITTWLGNVLCIKNCTNLSNVLLLCLVQFLMHQLNNAKSIVDVRASALEWYRTNLQNN